MIPRCGGDRSLAMTCGHVCDARQWLMRCAPTSVTAAHFSLNFQFARRVALRLATLNLQRPFSCEGFNVFIDGRFHMVALTQGQMTVVPTFAAKDTAARREMVAVGALLPRSFIPGIQACVLGTNGDPAHCRRWSGDGPPPVDKTPLCTCTPLEVRTTDALRALTFVQVGDCEFM
jgi:hypothetical protein